MSTFYGNSAMGNGAISYIVTPDIATTLRSCIVIENSGNEQFYNENSVTSTLVPLDVTEYNIFGNEPAGFDVLDQINVSTAAVNLLPLAFNGTGVIGAVTRTMLPGPGSVAIDAADPTNIGIAQNGPTYGVRDIGAAEACIDISSTISVHACETYTVPSGDETYTVNGTYLDTITRVCGADSIITIELFIGTPETSSNDSTICIGSDFIFPDGVLIENVTSTMSHESILASIYGCDSTVTTTVYVRALPTMSTIVTNATCGDENGSIVGTISGDGPFDIYWSNGDTIVDIIELFASTYYATITDVHGCQNVVATSVTTSGLDVSAITTDNACPGLTSGSIDLTIVGDDAPFIIQWSNGSDQEDIENLGAGNYEVLVTDDNGCISSASFDIIDPDEIDVEFVVSDAGCGLVNGAVDATITGGTFGYTFSWRDETNTEVSTNEDLTGADEGNYSLTVSDLNGCLYSDFVSISESGAPTLSVNSITTASCNNDGAIDLNITSGEAINSITWSNLETTEDISGLSAGSYSVSVENASNCVYNLTVNVPTSAPIPVEICLVTVDTLTNTNKVIWEKPVSTTIDKFIIYRESSIAGQYLILDTVDYADESEYTDLGAFPQLRSWRYKLATLNTCGVKSALSPPHKTIHMVISQFGGDVSVQWDNYQGFSFATYNIYRYNAETGWNLWQQIPNNLFSVTDDNPQGTDVNYVVEAVPTDPCVSEKVNSYGETRSNRQNIAGALQSAPVADFSGDNTTILSGETVTFTDESAANPSVNQWSWTFEGGTPAASIDQSPTIEYTTAGVYEVELIAINTLGRDTVTKTGYITVGDIGIEELPGINSLFMFPNPARKNVWISFNTSETQNITLELMNLDGKVIQTQNVSGNGEIKTQVDLSNVSKATYLLRIRTQNGSLMKRIVKQ
jgi:PKD repeat protein